MKRSDRGSWLNGSACAAVVLAVLPATGSTSKADLLVDLVDRSAPQFPYVERHEDWLLVCQKAEPPSRCQGQPAGPAASVGAPVALTIVQDGKGKDLVLISRAPLEVLLAFGVEVQVDGRAIGRLGFQLCDRAGCVAPAPLKDSLAKALMQGRSVELTVKDRDGKSQHSSHSLIGLTKLLRRIISLAN